MNICHFDKVDVANIEEKFIDNKHRCYLKIPFKNRKKGDTICVFGQNPSYANKQYADKTIYYVERYIYEKFTNISTIVILNLYSRIDTKKIESNNLHKMKCERIIRKYIKQYNEFFMIFGELKKQKKYNFPKKAKLLFKHLKNKNIYKINLNDNSKYAPHPGNPKIYYGNYCYGYIKFDLE